MRSTVSQRSPGVRFTIVAVPSTWPCTTCPPKRPSARVARSRLTPSLGAQRPEGAAAQGLGHDVDGELLVVVLRDGQAHAVDGDRGTVHGVADDERALHAQHGRVRAVLDGADRTELLDDSGEHRAPHCSSSVPSSRTGVHAHVSSDDLDVDELKPPDVSDGGDAEGVDGWTPRAEERRSEVGVDVVDETGGDEGGRERRTTLQPDVADTLVPELLQRDLRILGAQVQHALPGPSCTRAERGTSRRPMTTRSGCRSARPPPGTRAVRRGSSTSTVPVPTSHGVAGAPQDVRVGTRGGAGDPLARAVRGRAAPVERRSELPGHQRPARATPRAHRSLRARASSASTPPMTSTPAACSRSAPPAASGSGSDWAKTTRATPASMSASAHGPVRPVCARLEGDVGGRSPRPRTSRGAAPGSLRAAFRRRGGGPRRRRCRPARRGRIRPGGSGRATARMRRGGGLAASRSRPSCHPWVSPSPSVRGRPRDRAARRARP